MKVILFTVLIIPQYLIEKYLVKELEYHFIAYLFSAFIFLVPGFQRSCGIFAIISIFSAFSFWRSDPDLLNLCAFVRTSLDSKTRQVMNRSKKQKQNNVLHWLLTFWQCYLLYIFTGVWVLRTPNAGRNMLFKYFLQKNWKKQETEYKT